jgi:hypothetical protein
MSDGIVVPRQPPGEEADVGDEDPSLGAVEGGLEVFGDPSATIEPSEGPLDDPAAGQGLEAPGLVSSLDDLDRPLTDLAQAALSMSPP